MRSEKGNRHAKNPGFCPKIAESRGLEALTFVEAREKFPKQMEKIVEGMEGKADAEKKGYVIAIGREYSGKTAAMEVVLESGIEGNVAIIIGDGVCASIMEKITGENASYSETVYLGRDAKACIARHHSCSGRVSEKIRCIASAGAQLLSSNSWIGGEFNVEARNELVGKGASAMDFSLLISGGLEVQKISFVAEHISENCTSHTVFKSVASGKGNSTYDGIIRIGKNAGGSDALLECHGALLGQNASIKQLPKLEILTDDVKATHKATMSCIGDDELFYLCTRGISEKDAREMIVKGFLESIVLKLPQEMQGALMEEIGERLRKAVV